MAMKVLKHYVKNMVTSIWRLLIKIRKFTRVYLIKDCSNLSMARFLFNVRRESKRWGNTKWCLTPSGIVYAQGTKLGKYSRVFPVLDKANN